MVIYYTIPIVRRHGQNKSEMGYAFCLLHIEEFWKMAIPLFGATGNFNHQILPYGILFFNMHQHKCLLFTVI